MIHPVRFLHLSLAVILFVAIGAPGTVAETTKRGSGNAYKVLFIGNSHLFVNNVPARVRRRVQAAKGPTRIRTIATGGARLISFTRRGDVVSALKSTKWDVVVLQEASVSFQSPSGRRAFHQAVGWFKRRTSSQTRLVLYQTWPWRAGSRYLRGHPLNSTQMWGAIRREYAKVARGSRLTIAPVGRCWTQSPRRASFYSSDGNHASVAGSHLAAVVISRTIVRGRGGSC